MYSPAYRKVIPRCLTSRRIPGAKDHKKLTLMTVHDNDPGQALGVCVVEGYLDIHLSPRPCPQADRTSTSARSAPKPGPTLVMVTSDHDDCKQYSKGQMVRFTPLSPAAAFL